MRWPRSCRRRRCSNAPRSSASSPRPRRRGRGSQHRRAPSRRPRAETPRPASTRMTVAMFDGIDHLAIAVAELDDAVDSYGERFGMALLHREVIAEQGVEVALLEAGDGHV